MYHIYRSFWRGADKSLARPTSRYRRTELIVSLERGVCSCVELHVFSSYRGWKEACHDTRAISTTPSCELSSSFLFSARQGAEGNSRHSDRNIKGIAQSYVTTENWVAQFNLGNLSTCDAPRPGRPKILRLLIKFTSYSWETVRFRLNQ